MLMTRWVKCSGRNADVILGDLRRLGRFYRA
jgi:hypothetical protein